MAFRKRARGRCGSMSRRNRVVGTLMRQVDGQQDPSSPGCRMTVFQRIACHLVVAGSLWAASACHGLLEVSDDPTVVQDASIANAGGASARRVTALAAFESNVTNPALHVALLTDELTYEYTGSANARYQTLDHRDSEGYEALFQSTNGAIVYEEHLGALDNVVTTTSIALPNVRAYTPDSLKDDFLTQLFAVRGYAILQMAEDICSGFPINDVAENNRPIYSGPYTTDSASAYAVQQLDSAMAHAHDSVRFVNLARVARGRALLDLGRYTEAQAAVAAVPDTFAYKTDAANFRNNLHLDAGLWQLGFEVAAGDREGGNGLPFVSAQDPRVTVVFEAKGFRDTTQSMYLPTKYPSTSTPMVIASGIEARLIEAEAKLNLGDAGWFDILNALRTSHGMAAIDTMPTTASAQVDLVYRERAFWLYLTGRRLGDLRRLMRNYHRNAEDIFPTGPHLSGGAYANATAIPFIQSNQLYNPNIHAGCAVR